MDCSNAVNKTRSSIALVVTINKKGKSSGTGTGFVFSKKGVLVTCNHVVRGAESLLIKFPEGEYINAKVVVRDDEHDLALLKFEDDTIEPLILADVSVVKEGMPVVFSGYPLNSKIPITHQGILSAITKDAVGVVTYLIDGTVNLGNSGCPLMNSDGEVIGVVNATGRERGKILKKVEDMEFGALSLHGVDVVEIYTALIRNLQLGVGYAVPASYIPEHKTLEEEKNG
ncbi:MAG: serine protease [Patescibacteria group bacterium]|nr:serine protease [Patescibacteria group bacterium]